MHSFEDILARIDKYEYFDDEGGFQVFSPEHGKRPFKWEGIPEGGIEHGLALQFHGYYNETGSPDQAKEGAEEYFDRSIKPSLDEADRNIRDILKAVRSTSSKRIPNKLERILQELKELEPELRNAVGPIFQGLFSFVYDGIGELDEKGAESRLRICLYDVLDTFTNLSISNKIEHIVRLMYHFGIVSEEDFDKAFVRVHQTIFDRTRSTKHLDRIQEARHRSEQNRYP